MRLFVGVELDEAVKAAAAQAADGLRRRLARAAPGLDARWISPANLHITLVFIGEVDDGRGAAIASALGPVFDAPAFTLAIAGCGSFPPLRAPRVIWFGVRTGADAMIDLSHQVQHRLGRLGFEPERRAYSPHLTIARVKEVPRPSLDGFRQSLAATPVDAGACPITAVTLFRSRLSPKGAAYEAMLRVPLS